MSSLNRFLHVRIHPKKRKLENDLDKAEAYCVKIGYRLESYTDHTEETSFKEIHSDETNLCFNCEHNSFECEDHTLLNAHVPTAHSNLRLKLWPADKEAFKKQNMFMAFRFEATTGNPALLNELFWIRLILLILSVVLLGLHYGVRKLPFTEIQSRNELLNLIGRQLFLQVLMNDPLWIFVFSAPNLAR